MKNMNYIDYINKNLIAILVTLIVLITLILLYRLYILHNTKLFESFESSNEPKIAFLFLTYNNLKRPDIWNKFFDIENNNNDIISSSNTFASSKYSNKFTIYNHAKEPENVTDILLKGKHIPEHIETCWGCFGTVEANILMMKEAMKDSLNTKFILVSESCIPIVSFDKFYNEIMKDDKSRFKMWDNNNTIHRYNDIVETDILVNNFVKHNGQGIILNRYHLELLVNSLSKYKNNWKNMGCVDEHYFGNILKQLDLDFDINNNSKNSMFNSWLKDELDINKICNDNSYESICKTHHKGTKSSSTFENISNKAIDELRTKNYLLARKVDKDTEIDVDYIIK
jgi:hypothetical protein